MGSDYLALSTICGNGHYELAFRSLLERPLMGCSDIG